MLALVWCRGKVYYQMDKRAAIGEKYDVPERYTDRLRTLKQLRLVCSESPILCSVCVMILCTESEATYKDIEYT
jgi:hypothetical protein